MPNPAVRSLLLALVVTCPLAASATPWGEDRPVPTEDECAALFDGMEEGSIPVIPPDCDQEREQTFGLDDCGCSVSTKTITVCPLGSTVSYEGFTCSLLGTWTDNETEGSSSASGGSISVPGAGSASAWVSELLVVLGELADTAGRDFSRVPYEAVTPSGASTVIYPGESDVDASDPDLDSLDVQGLYVVLDDLTVHGELNVSGILIVAGTISAGNVTVGGAPLEGGGLGGGMIFARSAVIESLAATDCILYVRDLLTNEEGAVSVAGSASADNCFIDAGDGFSAATDLTLADTTLAARSVSGATVTLMGDTVTRLQSVLADTLSIDTSEVDGGGRLEAIVTGDMTVTASNLAADGLGISAASLTVDGASTLEARHRDDASAVLPIDPDESEATGLYLEQVWGASFGGFGGTEAWFNGNTFRPAESPAGDPRDPAGPGVDGWALSWADTTYGGGGGNDVDLFATGTITVNGELRANGGSAPVGPLGGGGSGGSGGVIRVEAQVVAGSATLRANGGDGALQAEGNSIGLAGGGGSGGRIAVLAEDASGAAFQYEAVGGLGAVLDGVLEGQEAPIAWEDPRVHGGPGTTFIKDAGGAELRIDGNGLDASGWGCPEAGAECRGVGWLPQELAGVDVVVDDATVTIGDLTARSLTLHNARLVVDDPRVRLPWPPPSHIVPGGLSSAQVYLPAAVYADPLSEKLKFTLEADLSVDAGSVIDLAGYGGYSRTTEAGVEDAQCWNGGSHGGVGGAGMPGSLPDTEPEAVFDDEAAPKEPGRGGCANIGWTPLEHEWCGLGGVGGAALRVVADGTVEVDGRIDAAGFGGRPETEDMYCLADLGNAGGAGGSIWITAAAVTGAGVLDASGGDGATNLDSTRCGGGGGGGRVAVDSSTNTFNGTIGVAGGASGCPAPSTATAGGDGSVHVEVEAADPDDSGSTGREPPGAREAGAEGCGCDSAGTLGMTGWLLAVGAAFSRARRNV